MIQPFHVRLEWHVNESEEWLEIGFYYHTDRRYDQRYSKLELGHPEVTVAMGDWLKNNEREDIGPYYQPRLRELPR